MYDLFLLVTYVVLKGTFTFCLLSCRVATYVVFLGWVVECTLSNWNFSILSRWFERANIFYRQSHDFVSFQHSSKMESGCLCSGTNNGSIWTWVGVVAKWVVFFYSFPYCWTLYWQFLATIFVLVNLFGQLGGCALVIARYQVTIACSMLFFIVVLQVRH